MKPMASMFAARLFIFSRTKGSLCSRNCWDPRASDTVCKKLLTYKTPRDTENWLNSGDSLPALRQACACRRAVGAGLVRCDGVETTCRSTQSSGLLDVLEGRHPWKWEDRTWRDWVQQSAGQEEMSSEIRWNYGQRTWPLFSNYISNCPSSVSNLFIEQGTNLDFLVPSH